MDLSDKRTVLYLFWSEAEHLTPFQALKGWVHKASVSYVNESSPAFLDVLHPLLVFSFLLTWHRLIFIRSIHIFLAPINLLFNIVVFKLLTIWMLIISSQFCVWLFLSIYDLETLLKNLIRGIFIIELYDCQVIAYKLPKRLRNIINLCFGE